MAFMTEIIALVWTFKRILCDSRHYPVTTFDAFTMIFFTISPHCKSLTESEPRLYRPQSLFPNAMMLALHFVLKRLNCEQMNWKYGRKNQTFQMTACDFEVKLIWNLNIMYYIQYLCVNMFVSVVSTQKKI